MDIKMSENNNGSKAPTPPAISTAAAAAAVAATPSSSSSASSAATSAASASASVAVSAPATQPPPPQPQSQPSQSTLPNDAEPLNADSIDVTELIDITQATDMDGGTSSMNENFSHGQILSDFLHQLEDYTPTIPDAVTAYFCQTAGFEASDPRIVRLISIAAQKFVSDVANDALQHCKTRTSNAPGSHASSKNQKQQTNKDRKYTLTMEDLAPALSDYGITVRKAHYFV